MNLEGLQKLVESWPRRAGVRSDRVFEPQPWDPARPDYPIEMLPFHQHATFCGLGDDAKQQILTLAWLVYNERVITAEEFVANPALMMLSQGAFVGVDDIAVRVATQQTLVDEHFHTLMHMQAIEQTRVRRGVRRDLRFPHSVTYRRLLAAQAAHPDKRDRDLLTLCWGIVAEISVNSYLSLLSTNETIQPSNRMVPYLHNRDEFAHSSMFMLVSELLYRGLSLRGQAQFCRFLPQALTAFVEQDYSALRVIVDEVAVPGGRAMIDDCARDASFKTLTRDFSGIREVVRRLDIEERVDFQFG